VEERLVSTSYSFLCPTAIQSGAGIAEEVGVKAKALGCTRALVVTDPGVARTPHLGTIIGSLSRAGIGYHLFDRVEPDPSIEVVESSVEEVGKVGFDVIVALGGGSSIDVAKGLRLLCQYGGKLRDYAPGDKIPGQLTTPLIAISTTAGTGSQVSYGAVFSDHQRGTKFAVNTPKMAPTLALNDPLVTMGAPTSVTATAGMDALAHAIESYLSVGANPIADALDLEAIRMIGQSLPKVMEDGGDLPAREAMLTASTIAIMGGTNTGLGACHAVAMPLCAMFNLPHGLVVGAMIGRTMEYNLEAATERLARVAEALGIKASGTFAEKAAAAADAVVSLSAAVGLPQRLRDMGFKEEKFGEVAALTMQSFQVRNNPRVMTAESIEEMLRRVY
jgi:alcohol dehydrogenase